MASPTRHFEAHAGREEHPPTRSCELWPVFVLLWIVSVVRVATALSHHDTFGTIDTLALVSVAVLPWMMKD